MNPASLVSSGGQLERAGKYLIREEHDDKLALNARPLVPALISSWSILPVRDDVATSSARSIHDAALKDTPVLSLSSNSAPKARWFPAES